MARFLQLVYNYLLTTLVVITSYFHSLMDRIFYSRLSLYDGNKLNNYLTLFFIGMIVGWVLSYYHTLKKCGYVL